jgi:hypothetical protein
MSDCKLCNKWDLKDQINDLQKSRVLMMAERIAARNDFDILISIIRDQYIALRVAPYRTEYERLLKEAEENSEKNQEKSP